MLRGSRHKIANNFHPVCMLLLDYQQDIHFRVRSANHSLFIIHVLSSIHFIEVEIDEIRYFSFTILRFVYPINLKDYIYRM